MVETDFLAAAAAEQFLTKLVAFEGYQQQLILQGCQE
jgi:hypothetical protein